MKCKINNRILLLWKDWIIESMMACWRSNFLHSPLQRHRPRREPFYAQIMQILCIPARFPVLTPSFAVLRALMHAPSSRTNASLQSSSSAAINFHSPLQRHRPRREPFYAQIMQILYSHARSSTLTSSFAVLCALTHALHLLCSSTQPPSKSSSSQLNFLCKPNAKSYAFMHALQFLRSALQYCVR